MHFMQPPGVLIDYGISDRFRAPAQVSQVFC